MTGTKFLSIVASICSCLLWLALPVMAAEDKDAMEANAGWSGAGFLVQEKWGVLGVNINNRSGKDEEVLVTNLFDEAGTVQYSQRVWVPANCSRRVWQPVRMPPLRPEKLVNDRGEKKRDVAVAIQTLALGMENGQERQRGRYDGVVRLENGTQPTGVLADSEDDPSLDAVVAGRISMDIGPRLASMRPSEVPSFGAGLSVLDTFFLCRNDPALDPAQLAALRTWLLDGGRLWVMGEQVSPEFMRRLLGDDWSVQTVDHVGLMSVRIDGQGAEEFAPLAGLAGTGGGKESPERRNVALEFEKPVDFARTVVSGMEVMHTVNGWPASARKQIGRGWLYVTFIGPEAMIENTITQTGKREYKPTLPIEWLSGEFFKPATPAPLQAANFVNYLQQEIGHKIIGRGVVVAVLGGFALVLLVAGLYLSRIGRLERIGVVGAVGAVAATLTLLLIGQMHRAQRPLMTVSTHLAEVSPATGTAVINGELGVYSPIDGMGPMRSKHGGVAWPDVRGQDGKILRMHFLDFDQWEWQNLSLPAGAVRASDVAHSIALEKTPRITAVIGEKGVTARLDTGSLEKLEDVLFSTAAGQIAPKFDSNGSFKISDDQILPQGQYITSGIQDQVQSRRQQMYKTMMSRKGFPDRPLILGWSGNVKVGIDLVQECLRQNSALVTIPLEYEPVKPGTAVSIPSMLMNRVNARVSTYSQVTLDRRNDEQSMTMDARYSMAFRPPAVATPMTVSKATLFIDLRAPGRPVKIFAIKEGERGDPKNLIAEANDVNAPITIPLEKLKDYEVGQGGGVVIGLSIGSPEGSDPSDPASLRPWRLLDIRMSVDGEVHQ